MEYLWIKVKGTLSLQNDTSGLDLILQKHGKTLHDFADFAMERGNAKFDERIQRIFIVALLNLVSVLLNFCESTAEKMILFSYVLINFRNELTKVMDQDSAMLAQNSLNAAIKNH